MRRSKTHVGGGGGRALADKDGRITTMQTSEPESIINIYRHVCKVEYDHPIDKGILHQLQHGVLRIDVDVCTVHELQIFKSFFSRFPHLRALCVARNQAAAQSAKKSQKNKVYGSVANARIRQSRVNALKKAAQGTLGLVCKLLSTPRHCRLLSLALPGMHLTDYTASRLEEGLKACNTLRELDFRGQDLGRSSMAESVLRAVSASGSLQAVCLKGCRINARSARYIVHLLRKNNERRDQLTWRGELRSEVVSKQAVRLQGLLVLDVSDNDLRDEGVLELVSVLENDRWVAAVNFEGNGTVEDTMTEQRLNECFDINREFSYHRCHCMTHN